MTWESRASCLGMNSNIFFPDPKDYQSQVTKMALSICRSCPVRAECLVTAINNEEAFGIWGGLSSRSRNKIVKRYGEKISIEKAKSILERS